MNIIHLMPCRYEILTHLISGYEKVQKPLIGFDGKQLVPFFGADDLGLYLIVPWIVRFFGVSLDVALNIFFPVLIFCSCIIAFIPLYFVFPTFICRINSFLTVIFLGGFCLHVNDMYMFYILNVLVLVPWTLYFYVRQDLQRWQLFFVSAGMFAGFCTIMRSGSSYAVLLFMSMIFGVLAKSWLQRLSMLVMD